MTDKFNSWEELEEARKKAMYKRITLIVTLTHKTEKRKTLGKYCDFEYMTPDEMVIEIKALKPGADLVIESWYGNHHLKFIRMGSKGPTGIMISCKKMIYVP